MRCVAPTSALDVVAVGLADGRALLYNLRCSTLLSTKTPLSLLAVPGLRSRNHKNGRVWPKARCTRGCEETARGAVKKQPACLTTR